MKKLIGLACAVVFAIAVAGCSKHGKPVSAANTSAASSAVASASAASG
ncbi:MAG: hypothetical protein P1U63_07850 [Coxiellaceae bacterium]|nr:hypothetical protein [Coxiellaceae bacterium]